MSYTVDGNGSGVDAEKATKAFRKFVRALDEATVEGGVRFNGSFRGTESDGVPFNLYAEQVRVEDSDKERTARAEKEREEAEAAAEA